MATKIDTPHKPQQLPTAIIKNIINLSTSGFGLVVALAWNEFIQAAVNQYLVPFLGKGSDLVSLLIYALVVTVLAVVVTMQLARIEQKLQPPQPENKAPQSENEGPQQ